VESLNS